MKVATEKSPRIAIIGAGPIGLEAALFGRLAGWHVDLYERGRVAANVCDWGHVRLFSPWEMNSSPWSRELLRRQGNDEKLPAPDAFLTGHEYIEHYLLPLSRSPLLADVIHEQTTVVGVTRSRTWKGDLLGDPARGSDPFRLLLDTSDGRRRDECADVVLDCSGVYANHNWLGAGGLPAVGEIAIAEGIDYRLPDILGRDKDQFSNQTTLVVGGGYSAATAIVSLAQLAKTFPNTQIIWITRSSRTPPLIEIENDPLPERRELTVRANQLAMQSDSPVSLYTNCLITQITEQGGGRVSVQVAEDGCAMRDFTVDRIIANVGYRPDRSLYEELQVHECYASSGPIKLAASLLGETSSDCLNQSSGGAEVLRNPEPGFFILGAKSYGRDSRFLIRTGIEQVRDVYALIAADYGIEVE